MLGFRGISSPLLDWTASFVRRTLLHGICQMVRTKFVLAYFGTSAVPDFACLAGHISLFIARSPNFLLCCYFTL
jgi:hypothetical protein